MSSYLNASALKLCKFYTKPDVAQLLIDLIGDVKSSTVADVCSGKGSLALAALSKWRINELLTLDIDTNCEAEIKSAPKISHVNHTHIAMDMLDTNSYKLLKKSSQHVVEGVDITLCNPPYLYGIGAEYLQNIINSSELAQQPTISPDIAFIAQCLNITKDGGTIGLILSDSLISSQRYKYFRNALSSRHQILHVVQLPRNSFTGTEAQAYLVILKKNSGPTLKILISEFDGLQINSQYSLDIVETRERWDFSFHELEKHKNTFSLSEIGAEIVRGNLNSKDARLLAKYVFHINSFPDTIGTSMILPKDTKDLNEHVIYLQRGDIAIARIGRNLHRKIIHISQGSAPITDCVYRVRVAAKYRKMVLSSLSSPTGIEVIRAHAKGVGALSLSKTNLLNLRLPIQEKS